ncbi:hypothetical protein ElyMa_004827800 [Elysia marginata]|uniref:Secreted protein n=1 Tax=Elysia marginata TaxID=1093978 RepID=A0AAV4ILX3_9GAST|nr:hypothetical protein ElyMa_004827800 [Elysia marginata]
MSLPFCVLNLLPFFLSASPSPTQRPAAKSIPADVPHVRSNSTSSRREMVSLLLSRWAQVYSSTRPGPILHTKYLPGMQDRQADTQKLCGNSRSYKYLPCL